LPYPQAQYLLQFQDALLSHMVALGRGGYYMSPRVTNLLFQSLSVCINIKETYK
jgi:hypothetical protein